MGINIMFVILRIVILQLSHFDKFLDSVNLQKLLHWHEPSTNSAYQSTFQQSYDDSLASEFIDSFIHTNERDNTSSWFFKFFEFLIDFIKMIQEMERLKELCSDGCIVCSCVLIGIVPTLVW